MAERLSVGDNVRWHRPTGTGRAYPAFVVDGSVGVVKGVETNRQMAYVTFEVYGETRVFVEDLTPYCPASLSIPEEVMEWLDS